MNIEFIAYAGGIALLLVFVAMVLGMAWCAHCTPEYLGTDERLSAAPATPMIGTGWPAGRAEPSRAHADHLSADGGDGER